MISKQKEIFNKLADQRLEEINNLDKKMYPVDLIYRYKGFTADAKFNEFDNAFSPLVKTRDGKINLAGAKNDLAEFKSNISEIKNETKNMDQRSKKIHCIILKCFTKQGTVLLNFLMIILQWYLKQNLKQLKEQKLK